MTRQTDRKPWWIARDDKRMPSEVEVPLLNLSGIFPGLTWTTDEISDSDWNAAREQAWAIREGLTDAAIRASRRGKGK